MRYLQSTIYLEVPIWILITKNRYLGMLMIINQLASPDQNIVI